MTRKKNRYKEEHYYSDDSSNESDTYHNECDVTLCESDVENEIYAIFKNLKSAFFYNLDYHKFYLFINNIREGKRMVNSHHCINFYKLDYYVNIIYNLIKSINDKDIKFNLIMGEESSIHTEIAIKRNKTILTERVKMDIIKFLHEII